MAEIESVEVTAEDREAFDEEDRKYPILPIAGGADDDDDDVRYDDRGEDDDNLSNQNPDSDD